MAGTEYFKANDPFKFAPQISVLFPSSGLRITGHPATGRLSAHIPRSTYTTINASRDKRIVVDQKILSSGQAESYRRIFDMVSASQDIPWILGPLSLIPGIGNVITLATSTIDGLTRLAKGSVSADQLSVLMAAGGAFIRSIGVEDYPGTGQVLGTTVFYTVKVGDEVRLFGIYAAAYGLTVDG